MFRDQFESSMRMPLGGEIQQLYTNVSAIGHCVNEICNFLNVY